MPKIKFSEETCESLIENYSEGLTITDCADIAGIHRNTVTNWMKKGEKAKSGKYREFYLGMLGARSKFKKHHLKRIADAKDWRASQYLLQVVDSERYVVADKKQVKAEVKSDVTVNLLDKVKEKRKELDELRND